MNQENIDLCDTSSLSEIEALKNQIKILEEAEKVWEKALRLQITEHAKIVIELKEKYRILEVAFYNSRNPKNKKEIDLEEKDAIDFINQNILIHAPKEGELQAEGLWDKIASVLIEKIKEQAISYAGKSFEYLKAQGIEWAINLADYALEKLQDYLFEKYKTASEKEKEVFKSKIIEKFPESGLANKLKNEKK